MKPILLTLPFLSSFAIRHSSFAAAAARILIIVGPSNHPPGSHEVAAGGRVMQHCLEHMENVPGVKAAVVYEWPAKSLRDAATTVVFIGDTFPAGRFPNPEQNLADLDAMMKRGRGIGSCLCRQHAGNREE